MSQSSQGNPPPEGREKLGAPGSRCVKSPAGIKTRLQPFLSPTVPAGTQDPPEPDKSAAAWVITVDHHPTALLPAEALDETVRD